MTILFWDIDGTLMKTGRAGLYAFAQATCDLFGVAADLNSLETAGMTDCYIAGQIIARVTGRPATADEVRALIARYEQLLPEYLAIRQGRLMPAVADILANLAGDCSHVSLLLTGNTRAGAKAKLTHYGIAEYFDFEASGFGDNCPDRCELAAEALAAAQRRYSAHADRIFVIGDTPNDIRCGKAIGARTIAVATGTYSLGELTLHDPWWAVEQLPPPAEFMAKLSQAPGRGHTVYDSQR
ncbi:haloacid dehalogenase-like hydrolase [Sporolituus thermophilus]|uniref:Phosphoglycolate phosphatase, HAD superfamily n=1 Tax=Sporolituus thermophilus DSM 23256 TaxID=1123285 RepID=A0A1G7L9G1_9FIRM|nr:haloacid dehalogenase-like hydrolase [Sporolituus thermophilus]SDF46167.1 Phosphoglycolate phosphatase, HAD superfamily [Sporolituus thermophilus DSM 23256]